MGCLLNKICPKLYLKSGFDCLNFLMKLYQWTFLLTQFKLYCISISIGTMTFVFLSVRSSSKNKIKSVGFRLKSIRFVLLLNFVWSLSNETHNSFIVCNVAWFFKPTSKSTLPFVGRTTVTATLFMSYNMLNEKWSSQLGFEPTTHWAEGSLPIIYHRSSLNEFSLSYYIFDRKMNLILT